MYNLIQSALNMVLVFYTLTLLILLFQTSKFKMYHNLCLHFLDDPACIRALCKKFTNHENKKIASIAHYICKYLPTSETFLNINLSNTKMFNYWINVRKKGNKDLITSTIQAIIQNYKKDLKDQTSITNSILPIIPLVKQFRNLFYQKLYENNDFILFKDQSLSVNQDQILLVILTIKAIFESMVPEFYLHYHNAYKNIKLGIVFKDFTGRKDGGYYRVQMHEIYIPSNESHDWLVEALIHEFAHSINTNQSVISTTYEPLCDHYKKLVLKHSGSTISEYYMFTNPCEFHSEMILYWLYDLQQFTKIDSSYSKTVLWGFKKNGVNHYFDKAFIQCMGPYLDKKTKKKKNFVKYFIQHSSKDLIQFIFDFKGAKI